MQSLGALIAAARRRTLQLVMGRAAEHRISAQQFWMVVTIQEAPGISQVEISDRTLADAASVSRALSGLSDRGLVSVATDPEDRRRTRVRLTPTGDLLARELLPAARELREGMVNGMTPAEVRWLCAALQRLLSNLEDLDGSRRAGAPRPSPTQHQIAPVQDRTERPGTAT